MGKHRKHAKLKLRGNDNFAPNELAILGSNCTAISSLVHDVALQLDSYKLAYFDASHKTDVSKNNLETFTFHSEGSAYIDLNTNVNKFNQRILFSQFDFVFINGNHYQADKQILILDPDKEASIKKRLEQLKNIQFVIYLGRQPKYFDFLKLHNPTIENIHCYHISDVEAISKHIENLIQEKIAHVQGLVLAGGKSVRMGKDKGALEFFGRKQRDVAIDLLKQHQMKTYLSVREEQDISIDLKIADTFIGLGPFGAICSAFQTEPNIAWLVLATDLPFVNSDLIKKLLANRDPSKIATCIKGKGKQFVEPLVTIWEPKSYPVLLSYLAQGYSCPRKVLINSDVKIVEVEDALIRNINTPEDYDAAVKELHA